MRGFRLGSIGGFEIRVDLSWFLIFFLILWTFTTGVFPGFYPGLSGGTYLAMGIVGTLLFFTSLLLHELSHSFVAQSKGIPVEGITLFAFGGVSRTRMDAETPGDEFQIAGVGPLTSLAIALVFWLIAAVGRNAGWSIAVVGVAEYLALINVVLAVFNLLPGFPLDGGRVFRSIVWKVTGNLRKATRIATAGGRILGFLLMALGAFQLFSPNFIGGLWLILIGWFLSSAAAASYQDLVIRSTLKNVRAKDVMTRHPETASAHLTLREFVDEYALTRRYQAFPVVDNEHLVGIITLNQVKEIPRQQWRDRTVSDTMMPLQPAAIAHPNEQMTEVLQRMQTSEIGRVVVVLNGTLEGIITAKDVATWLQRHRDFAEERNGQAADQNRPSLVERR